MRVSRLESSCFFFFLMIRAPPRSPLFPYPPLFRSSHGAAHAALHARRPRRVPRPLGALSLRSASDRGADHRDRCNAGLGRSEEHTSELQSQSNLVCRLLLEKKITTMLQHLFYLTVP